MYTVGTPEAAASGSAPDGEAHTVHGGSAFLAREVCSRWIGRLPPQDMGSRAMLPQRRRVRRSLGLWGRVRQLMPGCRGGAHGEAAAAPIEDVRADPSEKAGSAFLPYVLSTMGDGSTAGARELSERGIIRFGSAPVAVHEGGGAWSVHGGQAFTCLDGLSRRVG